MAEALTTPTTTPGGITITPLIAFPGLAVRIRHHAQSLEFEINGNVEVRPALRKPEEIVLTFKRLADDNIKVNITPGDVSAILPRVALDFPREITLKW